MGGIWCSWKNECQVLQSNISWRGAGSWFIWSLWSISYVWFVWLGNETNQINQNN